MAIRDQFLLITIGTIFSFLTLIGIKLKLFSVDYLNSGKNLGMFYVPMSFLLLAIFFYEFPSVMFLSFLILGISDPAAAYFGRKYGKKKFKLTSNEKTIFGSIVFFGLTFFLQLFFYLFLIKTLLPNESLISNIEISYLLFFISTALILTVTEAFCSKGLDNIFIPLTAGILFYILIASNEFNINQFNAGALLALITVLISFKWKFLTLNGSAAAFILGVFIFGLGGIKWTLPILTFFVLSSILSKIRKSKNENVELYFEKNDKRDYMQVFANGGFGIVLILFNTLLPSEIWYLVYVVLISSVCADTWATEFGTIKKVTTYNILNFKKIEQGKSGGISILGLSGAVLGALIISLTAFHWVNLHPIYFMFLIVIVGLSGSLIDSFLGATLQKQFICKNCGKETERENHCNSETKQIRGIKWINNDAVNLISSTLVSFVFYIIYEFTL